MPNPMRPRGPRREPRPAFRPPREGFQEEAGEEEADLARDEIPNRAPGAGDDASALNRADSAMRARMLQRLQSEHGNAYVQRLVSTLVDRTVPNAQAAAGARVQRDGRDAKIGSLLRMDIRTYTKAWAGQIAADLEKQMAQVSLAAPDPFITWEDLNGQKFITAAMRPVMHAGLELWNVLTSILAPVSPEGAMNRGRDADEDGTGPMEYKPAVAQELRILLTRQLNDSLARILPRYLAAKSQVLQEEEWRAHSSRVTTPGANEASPTTPQLPIPPALTLGPVSAPHEPSPRDIAPSHPMDQHVINALVSGVALVDVEAYRKSKPGPEASARPLHTIEFEVEVNTGPLAWVRVAAADATPEDVAYTLYGDATLAYSVTAAPPLFGVDPQKVKQEHWQKMRTVPRTGFAAGDVSGFGPTDQALAAPQHDEAAVNQAKDLPLTTMSKDEVVQRMRLTLIHLDDLAASAKTFGLDKKVAPVRAKIDARSQALQASTNPRDMLQWDAQSAGQLDVVIKAAMGIRFAAQQYTAMKTPSPTGRVDPVPKYVEVPLQNIADAYADAAALSDLVVTAKARLAVADEKSQTYPVDVMEGVLASLRDVLSSAKPYTGGVKLQGPQDFMVPALQAREAKLRERLVVVRETLVSSPTQAAEDLKKIHAEVDDLQTEVAMVGYLSTMDALIGELFAHRTNLGGLTGKTFDYEDWAMRLFHWQSRIGDILQEFRTGDKAKAREDLKTFLADGAFVAKLQSIPEYIAYREKKEALLILGFKLAAIVGIAIATAGVGTLVEGGLIGLGWSAAGFGTAAALGTTVVVSAAEAASFTFLSRQILESDSEHGSFILDFLTNWGLFTALKGVTAGYEAFVGAEEAATLIGKGTGLLLQFESATATSLGIEYAKKRANGQEMTRAEAREIIWQSAATFIGTAVGARVSKPMLEGFKVGGRALGLRIKTINAQRAQVRLKAAALEKSGNIKQAPEVLAKDSELLDQEQALLKDIIKTANDPNAPAEAKMTQEELAELGEMRKQNAAAQEGNARSRVMFKLEPAGGDVFLAPKGELNSKGGIADQYRELGDEVTPGPKDPVTQSESISVKPSNGAESFRVVEKAGPAEADPGAAKAEPTAAPAQGGCFVAGTLVMAEQGFRTIESLQIGDVVWAGDPQSGERALQRILHTWVHQATAVLDIQVGDTTLSCTPTHPFWVPGAGWQSAGSLRVGMPLLTRSGETQVVQSVGERTGEFTVFNLEVEGLRTYFIGEAAILVHNKAWELLPGLRPAIRRASGLRERIRTMSDARRKVAGVLEERARRIEESLAEVERRSNRAASLRDVEQMTDDLDAAVAELGGIERLQARAAILLKQARAIQKQAHTLADAAGGSENPALVNAANRCEQIEQDITSGALDTATAERYEIELTQHARELGLIEPADKLFTEQEIDEYLDRQFVSDNERKRGEIKPIDKSRMPEDQLDMQGAKKPGTTVPDVRGQILTGEVVAKAKEILGQKVSSQSGVEQAWQRARDRVTAREPLNDSNYEEVYNKTRDRFWIEVFDDASAKAFFEEKGFVFPKRGKAPLLGAALNKGVPVEEFRISLDHIEPKAKADNWQYALDADKLEYRMQADNTSVQHVETRHKELGR